MLAPCKFTITTQIPGLRTQFTTTTRIPGLRRYNHTALHWACVYGHAEVATELITHGCNTDLHNHRGKTAWDIAEDFGDASLLAVFQQFASGKAAHEHDQLRQESIRRERRPNVMDTFRDDIELDPARLDFWSVQPFDQWDPLGDGAYGEVFSTQADPDIEVGSRRFRRMALKVPKAAGVVELKGEVESLHRLSHPNVVQILGMLYGKTKGSGEEKHWAMALEWCGSDLTKLLYKPKAADPDGTYKPLTQMCELMEQIAQGLVYIHGEGNPHFDLKPDNILLASDGSGKFVPKLADFGMTFVDVEASVKDKDSIAPVGTWEYLAPECWKRKYGNPGFASDIFSFGMMLWEMVARKRIYSVFPGFYQDEFAPTVNDKKTGMKGVDVAQIAERLAVKEQRPPSTWTGSDDLEHHCPALLYLLMQACWVPKMTERPKVEEVLAILKKLKNQPGAIHPTREVEPDLPHLSYAGFLEQLGLHDKKQELSECGLDDGLELKQLVEMDDTDLNDDILADEDLELDEDTKAKFRDAVEALRTVAAATEADECSAAQGPTAVEMHAAWDTLTRELGGEAADSFGTLAAAVAEIERLRERLREEKDEELAANAKELAAKDGIIAQKDGQLAEKDGVIAQKDGQLAEKDGQLAANAKELVEKDGQLVANAKEIVEKDGQLAEKDEQLVANAKEIVEKDGQLAANVKELAANAKELEQLREQLER